jgi:hypothetical protein
MTDSTVTLIIGIAGIFGTLFSGFLGFYYADKARKDKYQHAVFTAQFEMLKKANLLVGRADNLAVMVAPPRGEYFDKAIEDIRQIVPEIANIIHEGSSLLPTELWVDLNDFSSALISILNLRDSEAEIEKENVVDVRAKAAMFATATRALLGVDELSEETFKLISGASQSALLSEDARQAIRKIADDNA